MVAVLGRDKHDPDQYMIGVRLRSGRPAWWFMLHFDGIGDLFGREVQKLCEEIPKGEVIDVTLEMGMSV